MVSAFSPKRRRRDSNPRAPEGKRISSAPRYDHFDTSANVDRGDRVSGGTLSTRGGPFAEGEL